MHRIAIAMASIALLFSAIAATAQESHGEISAQLTGQFTRDSTGFGNRQSASNSAGLLVGYRHGLYRWISVEGVYGYSKDTQRYFTAAPTPTTGFPFPNLITVGVPQARVQANVHEATGGLVFNLPFLAGFRPYVLAEGGALVFAPTNNPFGSVIGSQRDPEGVFVYCGGFDHPVVTSHLLFRAEYRGLLYHAPDFKLAALNTTNLTHTAQPSVGVVFRF